MGALLIQQMFEDELVQGLIVASGDELLRRRLIEAARLFDQAQEGAATIV